MNVDRRLLARKTFLCLFWIASCAPFAFAFTPASASNIDLRSLQQQDDNHNERGQLRPYRRRPSVLQRRLLSNAKKDDDDDLATMTTLEERFQAFLDTPFYDPDAVLESLRRRRPENNEEEGGSQQELDWFQQMNEKFASFVTNDYETAEAALVGIYVFVLVILTQQLVRATMYPSSGLGDLF
jgi:hypothetical protein